LNTVVQTFLLTLQYPGVQLASMLLVKLTNIHFRYRELTISLMNMFIYISKSIIKLCIIINDGGHI